MWPSFNHHRSPGASRAGSFSRLPSHSTPKPLIPWSHSVAAGQGLQPLPACSRRSSRTCSPILPATVSRPRWPSLECCAGTCPSSWSSTSATLLPTPCLLADLLSLLLATDASIDRRLECRNSPSNVRALLLHYVQAKREKNKSLVAVSEKLDRLERVLVVQPQKVGRCLPLLDGRTRGRAVLPLPA